MKRPGNAGLFLALYSPAWFAGYSGMQIFEEGIMQFKHTLPTIVLSGFLALGACSQPAALDYTAEIEAANANFEEAFATGSADAITELCTEDSVIMPPGMDAVIGKEDQALLWQGFIDSGIAGVELVTLEVDGSGDLATERGLLTLLDADGNEIATAKYVVAWKKIKGVWKLHFDIWNLNS